MVYLEAQKEDFMRETKIQWHSAFGAALGLDFGEDSADLIFVERYFENWG